MGLIVLLLAAVLFVILSTARLKLHPFLALLFAAIGFGILSGRPLAEVVESVRAGFGGTIGYIGIVIVAGTIIGEFLERSGGAFALAQVVHSVFHLLHLDGFTAADAVAQTVSLLGLAGAPLVAIAASRPARSGAPGSR